MPDVRPPVEMIAIIDTNIPIGGMPPALQAPQRRFDCAALETFQEA